MLKCWSAEPEDRPSFKSLKVQLDNSYELEWPHADFLQYILTAKGGSIIPETLFFSNWTLIVTFKPAAPDGFCSVYLGCNNLLSNW